MRADTTGFLYYITYITYMYNMYVFIRYLIHNTGLISAYVGLDSHVCKC
jgi:hypothetical protein